MQSLAGEHWGYKAAMVTVIGLPFVLPLLFWAFALVGSIDTLMTQPSYKQLMRQMPPHQRHR